MRFFDFLKRPSGARLGPSGELEAAAQLPPVEEPKTKKGPITLPSFLRSATPSDGVLPVTDRRLVNTNIESYRNGRSTRVVMRNLIAAVPDLAGAKNAFLRSAITSGYTAVAKNLDGTFSREGTQLLQQLLTRFDVLGDYKDGFCGISSLRSTSESLGGELITDGACAIELVLDKARLPRKLQPVSTTQIEFTTDGEGLVPQQNLGGEIRDLDIPTFFYTALDQDLLEPYSSPPFESAMQPVLFSTEFMNDLRRIIKRAIHPRLDITVVWDKFKEQLPSDAAHDSDVMRGYINNFLADLQTRVNDLKPEDALVHFDSVENDYLNNGNETTSDTYKVLQGLIDSKVTTAAKIMPSILGRGSGTQNMASAETLLFLKNAQGMVQEKLNEIYSRALTLAVRLFGLDVYVEFRYDEADLRPSSELEAFHVMRQERILRQLSLGMISDDEACIKLTGSLPPPGMAPLSGTGFMDAPAVGNPESNTGAVGTKPGQGSATNRALKPETPTKAKGAA